MPLVIAFLGSISVCDHVLLVFVVVRVAGSWIPMGKS